MRERWPKITARRYAGPVTVLVLQEVQQTGTATEAGWATLGRQARVQIIRGSHFTRITEHIDETARIIAAALE